MATVLFVYALADWRPWEVLAGTDVVYREGTTMTMAAIRMAQIGGAMA